MKPVIRISSAGKCPRALSAALIGLPAEKMPEFVEVAAKEGRIHEKVIKEQLREDGFMVFDEEQECIINGDFLTLIGHVDGKIMYPEDKFPRLLEIKTMSQQEFDRWMRGRWEEYPAYAVQVSLYMRANKLDRCLYYVKNRNTGYKDVKELIGPPLDPDMIIADLESMVKAVMETGAIVEANFDPTTIECRRCLYKHLCTPETKVPDDYTRGELDGLVELWRTGKTKSDEGEAQMETAKARFKEIMQLLETEKLNHNKLLIQIIHRHNESWNGSYLKTVLSKEEVEAALKISDSSYPRIIDLAERYK